MYKQTSILCCSFLTLLLLYCKNEPSQEQVVQRGIDTLTINNLIKQRESVAYGLLSDTVRNTSVGELRAYYSVTHFYYDSTTGDLHRAENIVQAANKAVFVAYFDKGNVLKTVANTDMGLFVDYHSSIDSVHKSNFKRHSLELAIKLRVAYKEKTGR